MPARRREVDLGAFSREPGSPPAPRPAPGPPPARTVGEVVTAIRRRLWDDPSLADVWVRGEISGFTAHANGHWYFSLKDEQAVLSAVMFRTEASRVRFRPEEGMEVLARGRIDVYPARSGVQVIVQDLRPVGAGELAARFDQLRRKLEAEGLFAPARKRPLPRFPRAIGIVTSLQGAALRDMVRIATDRHPGIRLVVCNTRVQGEGAATDIALAIARLNFKRPDLDVIIVGRGGGSAEDLWAFNEEPVVRAVVASRIPIVSAVGHESDVTLCDLAADVRASTPSNACELVVPDAEAIAQQLDEAELRMTGALERLVPDLRQRVDDLLARAEEGMRRTMAKERELLAAHAARLDALSPLAVLARGFGMVTKDGKTIRRAKDLAVGDDVKVQLSKGSFEAKVTEKDPDG